MSIPHHDASKRVLLACSICGTPFYRYRSQLTKSKEVFCSKACLNMRHGGRVLVVCVVCGKEIKRVRSHAERVPEPCCSRRCTGIRHAERIAADGNPLWNGGKITAACVICGVAVARHPSLIVGDVLCSKECRKQWLAQVMCGESNPHWRGGYREYYGPNWEAQRNAARARDQYRCQHCGVHEAKLGRELDVHHIQPFRTFGYIPGANEHYQKANQITNLISLCAGCHKRAESGRVGVQMRLI